jgi:hypothetical protein
MSTLNKTMTAYAQQALDEFVANLTPIQAFANDFSGVARAKGSAVQVPLVSNVTATTFNSTYAGTGGVVNSITVTLNSHRIATVDLSDRQQLETDITMSKFAMQLGKGLAKIVLQDIWSLILTTNYAAAVVTSINTNWSKATVLALRKQLAQWDCPMDNLSFVCDEVGFHTLLADTAMSQANYFGGSETIREAKIPKLYGATIYPTNILPTNSITLEGFLCDRDAVAVAFRTFDQVVPAGAYEAFDVLTDPESGISMTSRLYYAADTGKTHWSVEALFGYAVGVTRGLAIVTGPDA